MEDGTQQSLELCVDQYKARNMAEMAEIVQEYANRCPDAWDAKFMPDYWHGDPAGWGAMQRRQWQHNRSPNTP
jgi:hypothetical protein